MQLPCLETFHHSIGWYLPVWRGTCPGHWISKYGIRWPILCWCATTTWPHPPHWLYPQIQPCHSMQIKPKVGASVNVHITVQKLHMNPKVQVSGCYLKRILVLTWTTMMRMPTSMTPAWNTSVHITAFRPPCKYSLCQIKMWQARYVIYAIIDNKIQHMYVTTS